jgi:hypothetical protein
MAVAAKKLDIAIGDLVEVGGRRYDVVSDHGGGVALEPAITQPITEVHAEHGGRPLDEGGDTMPPTKEKPASKQTQRSPGARAEEKDQPKPDPRGQTRKRIRKIIERHRETFDELAK